MSLSREDETLGVPDEPVTSEYTVELPLGESTVLLTEGDAKQRGAKAAGKTKTSKAKTDDKSSRSAQK